MMEASIPVDLLNPGQVFACLGFLEAADELLGRAEGGFDWSDESEVRFHLRADGDDNPFAVVLSFLAGAEVRSLAPSGSGNDTTRWNVPTKTLGKDAPFPFRNPPSPATLPAVLEGAGGWSPIRGTRIMIDHWGDSTQRDAVKFWAGAGGYPGAALVRDALDLVRRHCCEWVDAPFSLSAGQSSSFRFDWRRDYIPIDAGFSLNDHEDMVATGFPLVELLAAVGLTNARPKRTQALEYRYAVIGGHDAMFFDPTLLRAALGDSYLPFPRRSFCMRLGWPGKEGQARCITTVTEETGI